MDPRTSAAQAINTLAMAPPDYGTSPLAVAGDTAQAQQFAHQSAVNNMSATANKVDNVGGALSSLAGIQDQNNKAAAAADADYQRRRAQAKADMVDPKKFQKLINDTGGYDFYDPSGNQISALDYSKGTNSRITDVLKDSSNQEDKDFNSDWNFLQTLGKLVNNPGQTDKDGKTELQKFWEKNPERKDQFQDSNYSEILDTFKEAYPSYFQFQNLNTGDLGDKFAGAGGVKQENHGAGGRNIFSRAFNAINPKDNNTWNTYYTDRTTGK